MGRIKGDVTNKQKDANKTVSEDLLESVRKAIYKLKDYLDNIEFNDKDDFNEQSKKVQSILSTGEKIGKVIESLVVLEKKVAAETMDKSKIRGSVKLSLLEGNEI